MLLNDEQMLESINKGRKANKKDGRDGIVIAVPTEYMLDHKYTNKAQLKKVVEWGDEDCPHREQNGWHLKHYCPKCWQSLVDEVKE